MTTRDFERFLREAGFSKKEAINIASHGFKPDRWDTEPAAKQAEEALALLSKLNSLLKR